MFTDQFTLTHTHHTCTDATKVKTTTTTTTETLSKAIARAAGSKAIHYTTSVNILHGFVSPVRSKIIRKYRIFGQNVKFSTTTTN